MERTFIQTSEFEDVWKRLGLADEELSFVVYETIYLITAYSKSEKTNLKKQECNDIKKAIELLEESL